MPATKAKRWYIHGIVQGVGFRYFVRTQAQALNLTGWTRNLSDGRVEVLAVGPHERLSELAAALHKGPPMSTVRHVEEQEAAPENHSDFHVR
jgi:acylphosphatase